MCKMSVETKLRFAIRVQPKTLYAEDFFAFNYEHFNVTLSGFSGWWIMFSMTSTESMYSQLYWSSIVKTYHLYWAGAFQNVQSKQYLISCKYTKDKYIRKSYAPELWLFSSKMCSNVFPWFYSVTASFPIASRRRLVFHKKFTTSSPARFIWQIFPKSRCIVSYFT